jgi:hypothetical protein
LIELNELNELQKQIELSPRNELIAKIELSMTNGGAGRALTIPRNKGQAVAPRNTRLESENRVEVCG